MLLNSVNLIECPRDAIQGIDHFISTDKKIEYINSLLASDVFEYIDFGSFVSPKAVPQLHDTVSVLDGLRKTSSTKLLAIIANLKGAEVAMDLEKIDYIGYPFSVSETFQNRNINSSIEGSFLTIQSIINIISGSHCELVVYISMAFGNPYGDIWNDEIIFYWIERLANLGINRFSIADTTSEASVDMISIIFDQLLIRFPNLEFSIHLHSSVDSSLLKVNAAFEAGCRRFEGAFLGYGGCPFAKDDLVGNIPTELLLKRFGKMNCLELNLLIAEFQKLVNNV